jgi:hypothetical protein
VLSVLSVLSASWPTNRLASCSPASTAAVWFSIGDTLAFLKTMYVTPEAAPPPCGSGLMPSAAAVA